MTNLVAVRGDTLTYALAFTDSGGDPLDLTGAEITMTVEDLFAKTVGDGITVVAPLTGAASVLVDPDDTESAPNLRTTYRYDVEVVTSDGTVRTPIRGRFIVLPDVTR